MSQLFEALFAQYPPLFIYIEAIAIMFGLAFGQVFHEEQRSGFSNRFGQHNLIYIPVIGQ